MLPPALVALAAAVSFVLSNPFALLDASGFIGSLVDLFTHYGSPDSHPRNHGNANGVFYLEFQAEAGPNEYYVQYLTNATSTNWLTARPQIITSRSNPVLWFDSGPPRTVRPPDMDGFRCYRVIRVLP